jgi:hypothetical protein
MTTGQQIENVMRVGKSDALPDEINWDRIIANWELPFPQPVRSTPENPMSEKDLARIARGGPEAWSLALRPPPRRRSGKERHRD